MGFRRARLVSRSVVVSRRPTIAFVGALVFAGATAGAATITVTGTGDTVAVDGVVTLREAIQSIDNGANVNADVVAVGAYGVSDAIQFNIPGVGVHTISPAGALPDITVAVTIDGYTQSGSSANTLAIGDDAVIVVVVSPGFLPIGQGVLHVTASNTTLRGLVVNGGGNNNTEIGISGGAAGVVVEGCFLGTDPTGTTAVPGPSGINIEPGGSNIRIGGPTPAQRNLISGNSEGIAIAGVGNGLLIQNNYIGTNAAGTVAIPNMSDGIHIQTSAGTDLGTTTIGGGAGAGNLISGNGFEAINVIGGGGTIAGLTIQGNLIGTDATGTAAIPNTANAVIVGWGGATTVGPVLVGGTAAGVGNVVSGSPGVGILINGSTPAASVTIQGNFVGTDVTGTLPIPNSTGIDITAPTLVGGSVAGAANRIAFNTLDGIDVAIVGAAAGILGNSIAGNGGLGINLKDLADPPNGVTPNDPCDADSGPSGLQNYPVLTSASIAGGNVTVSGTLNSTANTTFRVEFFSNTACDPSGFGQGQTFLGFATVTTDPTCDATFGPLVFAIPPGQTVITATATDPSNETSEFSACFTTGAPPVPTPTPTATATPTQTPGGPVPTPTPTPPTIPGGTAVPTLSPGLLVLLGFGLLLAATRLLRRGE